MNTRIFPRPRKAHNRTGATLKPGGSCSVMLSFLLRNLVVIWSLFGRCLVVIAHNEQEQQAIADCKKRVIPTSKHFSRTQ